MSRLTRKTYAELSTEERETFDNVVANRPVKPKDGHIGGPFDIWVRSPELGDRLVGLGGFFRFRTSVDRRYIELAILVTGQFWQAQFEWYAHAPMALEAGVPADVVEAIKQGNTPVLTDPKDQATYDLATELHHTRQVSEATFAASVSHFDEVGVAELVNLCGFYSMVSMTLNTFDVGLPKGAQKPFS